MFKLKDFAIEDQLFIYILGFISFISTITIISNSIIGFPFGVNYKWIAGIILSLIALKFVFEQKFVKQTRFVMFLIISFFLLPVGWLSSGGSNNFTIAYLFLIMIFINYLFEKKARLFFNVTIITMFILLVMFEEYFPHLLIQHEQEQNFKDMLVQIPVTLTAAALILKMFADAFRKEREKQREYSSLLQQKNEELEQMSITDELSRTYNRRYIFQKLNEMATLNQKVAIVLIDIDNFKDVNDKFGHIIGDKVIGKMGQYLMELIGTEGIVGRYGGDEFLIILNNDSIDESEKIASKLVNELNAIQFQKDLHITVSGGITLYDGKISISDTVAKADKLLYEVKKKGKNDVIVEGIKRHDDTGGYA
jgi:diguanylate cyclase (GGDEF)-like protein